MTEINQRLHQLAVDRKLIAFFSVSISVAVLAGLWFGRFPPGAVAIVWFSFAAILARAISWATPEEIARITAAAGPSNDEAG
ncbi:hypothetical protein OPU71_20915 [Niveibacterium sp. 24ML]|uniref:hypothetical protein n=1 Tax=Niveibacterium sp. 24ML TaxID=2985512 RepID=UPI00226FC23A|nr:hypothetical protein [Niveibacterium sp. 24ML]MCX9158582.1 hypothetical protein [Niveibacterium sp. 24ML]